MTIGNTSIDFKTFGKCKVEDVKYWRIYAYKRIPTLVNGRRKYRKVPIWKTQNCYTMEQIIALHQAPCPKTPYLYLVAVPRATNKPLKQTVFFEVDTWKSN